MCSLRMRFHIEKLGEYSRRGIELRLCMNLLGNCMRQHKNLVLMQLMYMLSIVFYKVAVLMFFLPGNSHMIHDCVVGYCKRALSGLNVYTCANCDFELEG